jgi:cytochrome c553
MSIRLFTIFTVAALVAVPIDLCAAAPPLTAAQKKELAAIRVAVTRVHVTVSRDHIDESEQGLTAAEQRLERFVQDAGLDATDSRVAPLRKMITTRRDAITRAREKIAGKKPGKSRAAKTRKKKAEQGISFTSRVAPILAKNCLGCHGKNSKGGLSLGTFAGMRKGGMNGPLLVEGDPDDSLLIARLIAVPELRMPKNAEPLAESDIRTIAEWIGQGAKFDGDDDSKPLDKLAIAQPKESPSNDAGAKSASKLVRKAGPLMVARPTGNEKVSFTKDVAPFMVERCLRCHSGNDPKGGLSLETFNKLLAGGKSGAVIEPGNLEKSRLWNLVGEQKPFKMPPGDVFIKRMHWNALKTWIAEGAKYDGGDPAQPLKSLVPSESQRRAEELGRLTPVQFREKRQRRSAELWRAVFPRQSPQKIENESFVLYGNVSAARLKEVQRSAASALQAIQAFFDDKTQLPFKGGLGVFIFKDRSSFEDFCQYALRREPVAAIHGYAVVTPDLNDVYIVVEDLADQETAAAPSARTNLAEQLASAYVMRSEKKMPDWLVAGMARVLSGGGKPKTQAAQVYRLVGSLEKPDDIFADGSFSAAAAGDVGEALVNFLIDAHGKARFLLFVKNVQAGRSQAEAFRDVYATDMQTLAQKFVEGIARAAKQSSD